jgi:hypothetical protein
MKKLLLASLQALEPKLEQRTGTKALKSGLYRSGNEIIPLSKGERFPPSPSNVWKIIVSV